MYVMFPTSEGEFEFISIHSSKQYFHQIVRRWAQNSREDSTPRTVKLSTVCPHILREFFDRIVWFKIILRNSIGSLHRGQTFFC